jgi:hypothetical protein
VIVSDASIGELLAKAGADISALVQANIDLAKAELRESAQRAGAGAGLIAAAIGLISIAGLLLSFAVVYGIVAAGLPVWAGFLIVGGVYLLIAVILGLVARKQLQQAKGPEAAIAAAQETKSALESAVAAGKASAAGLPDPAQLPPAPNGSSAPGTTASPAAG